MRPAAVNAPVDALCIGEAMAVLCPEPVGPLRSATLVSLSTAGAEANVARHLAGAGHRAVFASRVGADPFGDLIADALDSSGVESVLERDPVRPTGIYFKDPQGSHTAVHYYRAGSAASALDPSLWGTLPPARVVHLSGITPALSDSCAALVTTGLVGRPIPGAIWSFDVNHRSRLWPAGVAAPILLDLARRADLVFVGLDEAVALWGTSDVRGLLPGVDLVVKDGPVGATEYRGDEVTFVPAPVVEVVEPVGAGDAFAAGYLSGLLAGAPAADRLALGHRFAAAALSSTLDVGAS